MTNGQITEVVTPKKSATFLKIHIKASEWIFDSYYSLKTIMVGHGGSSAVSYLADNPIPTHCAVVILFKSVQVHQLSGLAL